MTFRHRNITVLLALSLGMLLALPADRAAADAVRPTVLVCPLRQIDQNAATAWVGRAVQQSLEVSLTRDADVRTVERAASTDASPFDPVAAARNAGASLVFCGSFHAVGDQVRLSCTLLDGQDGSLLCGWNTDGAANDLLRLEDECGDRAARAVRNALWQRNASKPAAQPLSRDQAAASIAWVTSPRVAMTPKPVAWQRDPRPFDDRADLAHYNYFYTYPACAWYGYGPFYSCGIWGWGCCLFGGPQATVGFYSQGSN